MNLIRCVNDAYNTSRQATQQTNQKHTQRRKEMLAYVEGVKAFEYA